MKRTTGILISGMAALVAVPMLCSCFGRSKEELAEQARLDSIAEAGSMAEVAMKVEAKRVADSLQWVNFTSPDLAFFDLHGHVKTMYYSKDYVFEFSEDGTFVKEAGKDPFRTGMIESFDDAEEYKRNKDGYICQSNGWEWYTEYKWADGRVASEKGSDEGFCWEYTYHYDDSGRLSSLTGKEWEFDEPKKSVNYTITYKEFDEMGNWTKRHSTGGGDAQRTITYYEK